MDRNKFLWYLGGAGLGLGLPIGFGLKGSLKTPNDQEDLSSDLAVLPQSGTGVIAVGDAGIEVMESLISEGIIGEGGHLSVTDHFTQLSPSMRLSCDVGQPGWPSFGSLFYDESVLDLGEEAHDFLQRHRYIVIIAGLGGNFTSSIAPLVAKQSYYLGRGTYAVCTLPPHFEGLLRGTQAEIGLLWLRAYTFSRTSIVESNTVAFEYEDIAKEIGAHKPLRELFRVGREKMAVAVKEILEDNINWSKE